MATMDEGAAPPAPLEYDPTARKRPRYRRMLRWLVAVAIATLLGWAGLRWGKPSADRAAYLYRQHRLMRYTPPPGRVVFDSNSDRARALIDAGLGDRPGTRPMNAAGPYPGPPKFVAFNPPEADAVIGQYYSWDTLLFIGGRQPSGGAERLVCVCAVVGPEIVNHPDIKARQELDIFCNLPLRPITWSDRRLQNFASPFFDLDGDDLLWDEPLGEWASLRIFAGRADPQDESRFSIEYEIEFTSRTGRRQSQRGFIDGRLGDDDHVHLALRPGPAADLWRQTGDKYHQEEWYQQQE